MSKEAEYEGEFACAACDQNYEIMLINGRHVPAVFCLYCGSEAVHVAEGETMSETASPVEFEQRHVDAVGDSWRTRFEGHAKDGGHFGIVPPYSNSSEIFLDADKARELRDRINLYLGES